MARTQYCLDRRVKLVGRGSVVLPRRIPEVTFSLRAAALYCRPKDHIAIHQASFQLSIIGEFMR